MISPALGKKVYPVDLVIAINPLDRESAGLLCDFAYMSPRPLHLGESDLINFATREDEARAWMDRMQAVHRAGCRLRVWVEDARAVSALDGFFTVIISTEIPEPVTASNLYAIFHELTDTEIPTHEQLETWTEDLPFLQERLKGYTTDLGGNCSIMQKVL